MKKVFANILLLLLPFAAQGQMDGRANVYFTSEITPQSLVRIYRALGVEATGRVAVKISTGESEQSNHLRPDFIRDLVEEVHGTLVECNTAYAGNRSSTAAHRRAIEERGYNDIAQVDIMDEEGSIDIPVADTTHLRFDRVGSHVANYDFLINLAHFKGHAMGGFGGVLKNQSIGMASREGKTLIHTAGDYSNPGQVFGNRRGQDAFLESMAAAAQAVHNYYSGRVIYIDVMNNLSVDCDCDGHPSAPRMNDIGILASLDPVALDKACLDLVFNHESTPGDDSGPLIERINRQHGTHIVDYAEQIGLGTTAYNLIDIDRQGMGIANVPGESGAVNLYNVYTLDGVKMLDRASSLDGLSPGIYIVNGKKTAVPPSLTIGVRGRGGGLRGLFLVEQQVYELP